MNHEYQIANIRVLPRRNLLIKDDQRLSLEPRIMEVLSFLARHPREVVLREDMISSVQFGGDESLTRAISLLRKSFKKLGIENQIIETIPKRGYRLAVPIEIHEASVSEAISGKVSFKDPHAVQDTTLQSRPETASKPDANPVEVTQTVPGIIVQQETKKNAINPLFPVIAMLVLCVAVLAFALRPSSGPGSASLEEPTQSLGALASTDDENGTSQGDVATAIILTYLDGHIDRETAITTATRHLKIARLENPNADDTLTAEGWMHYIQKNPDEAMLDFEIVTARDPLFGDAWLGKAFVYKDQGKKDLAVLNFNQAIDNNSFSMTPRNAKAQYLFEAGDFEEAKSVADDILFFDSDNQSALDLLSKISLILK